MWLRVPGLKKFNFKKRRIGIKSEKIMEKDREWKQVRNEVQGLLYVEQKLILMHLLFLV